MTHTKWSMKYIKISIMPGCKIKVFVTGHPSVGYFMDIT